MITLDPDIHGCVRREGYGYQPSQSSTRLPALKGRPRYRLKDVWPTYIVNASFVFQTMAEWNAFWAATGYGTDPFIAYLMLDSPDNFLETGGEYVVRAVGPWTGTTTPAQLWKVSIQLEVSDGALLYVYCDDIYGGPLIGLSPNDIYGGPIDGLSGDEIAPCPGVDPNG